MIWSKHTLCLYICVWFNRLMIYMLYWRITIVILSGYLLYQKSWQWWPIHFRIFQFCFNICFYSTKFLCLHIDETSQKYYRDLFFFITISVLWGSRSARTLSSQIFLNHCSNVFGTCILFSDNLDCLQENSYFAGFWLRYDM